MKCINRRAPILRILFTISLILGVSLPASAQSQLFDKVVDLEYGEYILPTFYFDKDGEMYVNSTRVCLLDRSADDIIYVGPTKYTYRDLIGNWVEHIGCDAEITSQSRDSATFNLMNCTGPYVKSGNWTIKQTTKTSFNFEGTSTLVSGQRQGYMLAFYKTEPMASCK